MEMMTKTTNEFAPKERNAKEARWVLLKKGISGSNDDKDFWLALGKRE